MPDVNRRNLSILNEAYEKINQKYKQEKKQKITETSFVKWVSEKLLLALEQEDYITQIYAPYLHTEVIYDNYVILRDKKLNKLVEVRFQDENMVCSEDAEECCPHIHFVFALPQLAGFFKRHTYFKKTRPIEE